MSVLWTLSNSWMSVIFVGLQRGEQYSRRLPTIDLYRFNITDMMDFGYRTHLRPEGGGGSRFSSFHIFDQSCWRRTRRKKPD